MDEEEESSIGLFPFISAARNFKEREGVCARARVCVCVCVGGTESESECTYVFVCWTEPESDRARERGDRERDRERERSAWLQGNAFICWNQCRCQFKNALTHLQTQRQLMSTDFPAGICQNHLVSLLFYRFLVPDSRNRSFFLFFFRAILSVEFLERAPLSCLQSLSCSFCQSLCVSLCLSLPLSHSPHLALAPFFCSLTLSPSLSLSLSDEFCRYVQGDGVLCSPRHTVHAEGVQDAVRNIWRTLPSRHVIQRCNNEISVENGTKTANELQECPATQESPMDAIWWSRLQRRDFSRPADWWRTLNDRCKKTQ